MKNEKVFGKYLDEKSRKQIIREAREAEIEKRMRKLVHAAGLVLSDAALFGMIVGELIDPMVGVVAVAVASSWFGYKIGK